MNVLPLIAALTVALIAGGLLFRLFFSDADDFWDCVGYSFTPDIFSLFRGEYFEDVAKSFKLGIYVFLVGGVGALTYAGIASLVT